jgi:hypothetical protein
MDRRNIELHDFDLGGEIRTAVGTYRSRSPRRTRSDRAIIYPDGRRARLTTRVS